MTDDNLLTSPQVADAFNISPKTLENWVHRGKVTPDKRVSGRNYYLREKIEALAKKATIAVPTQVIAASVDENDIDVPSAAKLLNVGRTTIGRLIADGRLTIAKLVNSGRGKPQQFLDREKVLELAKTYQPSPRGQHSKLGKKEKPMKRKTTRLTSRLAAAAKEVRAPAAPSSDEGKRLIMALLTLQEVFGKSDSEVVAELKAWIKR